MKCKCSDKEKCCCRLCAGVHVGLVFAVFHASWALLVLLGWAQGFLDWVHDLHFVDNPHAVSAFSWGTAAWGTFLAFAVGFVLAYVLVWVHCKKK